MPPKKEWKGKGSEVYGDKQGITPVFTDLAPAPAKMIICNCNTKCSSVRFTVKCSFAKGTIQML